ncbi:hypothetical protein FQZ97_842560 [compost metagenome]
MDSEPIQVCAACRRCICWVMLIRLVWIRSRSAPPMVCVLFSAVDSVCELPVAMFRPSRAANSTEPPDRSFSAPIACRVLIPATSSVACSSTTTFELL